MVPICFAGVAACDNPDDTVGPQDAGARWEELHRALATARCEPVTTTTAKTLLVCERPLDEESLEALAMMDGGYTCDDVKDCWEQCPEPEDEDDSVVCSCRWQEDAGEFECTIETIEGVGGSGGGSSPCTQDQQDLEDEYDGPLCLGSGEWLCSDFTDPPDARHRAGNLGIHGPEKPHARGYLHLRYKVGKWIVLRFVQQSGVNGAWVESSWRCPVGNARVGGTLASQHMEGTAGDFDASGFEAGGSVESAFAEAAAFANAGWSWSYGGSYHIDWRNNNED